MYTFPFTQCCHLKNYKLENFILLNVLIIHAYFSLLEGRDSQTFSELMPLS